MLATMDVKTYPDMHPAAGFALGALDFGRGRLIAAIEELTPEQLSARPHPFNNDIATLINHIAATEVRFSHMIQGKPLSDELEAQFLLNQPQSPLPRPEGETVASLKAKLETSMQHVTEMLKNVSEEDFARVIPAGPDRSFTVQWMVALLPLHQQQHLGQIQMLRKHI